MNLPLMSPAELDNSVYKLVAKEFGVANAMRFIARHALPDGVDYTRERHSWLPQDPQEIDRLLAEPDAGFARLLAGTRRKKSRRQAKVR